jgi:hypothetical protein
LTSCVVAGLRKKRGQIFLEIASRVAGVRHTTQGKIQMSVFPSELSTFNWKAFSFAYRKTSFRTFRLLEPPAFEMQSTEIRKLLSGISLITEILLD